MAKREYDEIKNKIDNILDTYFEELATCFEEKKDIQGLRGWLRINMHDAFSKLAKESFVHRYSYHATAAILIISILNLILIFFRYIFDPI